MSLYIIERLNIEEQVLKLNNIRTNISQLEIGIARRQGEAAMCCAQEPKVTIHIWTRRPVVITMYNGPASPSITCLRTRGGI